MQGYDDTNINRIEVEKAIDKTEKFYTHQTKTNAGFGLYDVHTGSVIHPDEYKEYFVWSAQYVEIIEDVFQRDDVELRGCGQTDYPVLFDEEPENALNYLCIDPQDDEFIFGNLDEASARALFIQLDQCKGPGCKSDEECENYLRGIKATVVYKGSYFDENAYGDEDHVIIRDEVNLKSDISDAQHLDLRFKKNRVYSEESQFDLFGFTV